MWIGFGVQRNIVVRGGGEARGGKTIIILLSVEPGASYYHLLNKAYDISLT